MRKLCTLTCTERAGRSG